MSASVVQDRRAAPIVVGLQPRRLNIPLILADATATNKWSLTSRSAGADGRPIPAVTEHVRQL